MIGLLMMLAATEKTYDSYMTGNTLLAMCETDKNTCTAYIGGVTDFLELMQSRGDLSQKVCIPSASDLGQLADVVIKALRADPAKRHEGAAGLAAVALADTFPCAKP